MRSASSAAARADQSADGPAWRHRLGELGQHLVRAGKDEAGFDPRQVLVRTITNALPHLSFNRTRTALLRASGVRLGDGALVMGPLNVTGPGSLNELLTIGDDTFITGPLHVDLGAPVRIGSCVRMGHHVVLLTVDHEIGPAEYRCGRLVAAPITIGDGVWIGSCVTILPGVSIGSGAVIAAGATVVRDIPSNTLAGGVPAKVVRDLDAEMPPASVRRGRSTPLED
jgi:acetyltransferase-like isoleucine patch superfamily enzyme